MKWTDTPVYRGAARTLPLIALLIAAGAACAQTVRVALIDPLSGPVAGIGKPWADQVITATNALNARGGVLHGKQVELVVMDNTGNVEKTNELLKKAYDDGIRYVILGIGSNHALATSAFAERQNKRSPERPMLFFNTSGGATALTNENCSYWHYRWGIGADMYAAALTNAMAKDPSVKRIFQLDQAYSLGQAFNTSATQLIKERLPSATIVGSELIQPFGKVQDFAPYVLKLKQLNVDTVVTSAYDVDFVRFYKAVVGAGLKIKFYAAYGNISSHMIAVTPQDVAAVPIIALADLNPNDDVTPEMQRVYAAYATQFGGSYFAERMVWMMDMFKAALEKAGSDDPLKVARALEEVNAGKSVADASFRREDHQFEFPMKVVQVTADVPVKYFVDGKTAGLGMKTIAVLKPKESMMPTTCRMARP